MPPLLFDFDAVSTSRLGGNKKKKRQSGPVQFSKDESSSREHSYTLLAEYKGEDELVDLVQQGMSEQVDKFVVPLEDDQSSMVLTRRSTMLMSAQQQRRLAYVPLMPSLLRDGRCRLRDLDTPFS